MIEGGLRSMASASGESPTDYHHSWGMCGNDGIITTVKPLYLKHILTGF